MKRVGAMRHRLTLQQLDMQREADGGIDEQWDTIAQLWGRVEPLTGEEFNRANKQEPGVTHKITTRYNQYITREKRFTFDNTGYNIRCVLNTDKIKDEMVIYAVATPGETAGSADLIFPPSGDSTPSFKSNIIDFTEIQDVTFNAPSGRVFFPQSLEIYCTAFSGVVSLQPSIRLGIAGNLSKYKVATVPTLLTGLNKRQIYSTLLAADGETQLIASVVVAGALASGTTYRGRIIVKGTMP